MIKVHGREYRDKDEVRARMEELRKLNVELGPSDGRVTERNALIKYLNDTYVAPRVPVFTLYWRTAKGGKGYREFKTERARLTFMNNHDDYAFTAYN